MTATIARLVLAMLLLPATGAVFLLSFVAIVRVNGAPTPPRLLLLWAVVYTFIAGYWVLLWRTTVRWTPGRIARTVVASALSLLAGFVFGSLCMAANSAIPSQAAILIGGGGVPIIWVLATVLVWRETPAERIARMSGLIGNAAVVCPACGYNLSGLREARCPECGGSFTLDQLAAAQPHRDHVEL